MKRNRTVSFLSNPYLPLAVFVAVTVGGCLFILFTKTKLAGLSPSVSVTVPILLMFLYLVLSVIGGKLRLHDEQTGDNLYYMGFLFTLTSLGVSLYQFSSNQGSMDTVVKNFGIAITSTIAGIALRIFYNQMRRDPADIERAARHELAEMTRRVRTEMETVLREFADFRRVSHQMLEEGFSEIAEQAARNGNHIRSALDKLAFEAIKPVQEASGKLGAAMQDNFKQIEGQFSDIAKGVEAAAGLLDKANTAMSAAVSRLGDQADNVAGKLQKVVVPDEVLKNDLAPLVKTLGDAVAQYTVKTEQASQEQQARMTGISEALDKVAEKTDRAAAAAEKTAEAAGKQQRTTEELVRLVQQSQLHAQPKPSDAPPLNGTDHVDASPARTPEIRTDVSQSLNSTASTEKPEVPAKPWWRL